MSKELSAEEVRQKLQKRVEYISTFEWLLKLGMSMSLVGVIIALVAGRMEYAALLLAVSLAQGTAIMQHNMHKLILKLHPYVERPEE
ncbi:MAG: hypothetical protein ACYS8X_07760 [Planctomycetota bacterium]|jgi:hypothetical protein